MRNLVVTRLSPIALQALGALQYAMEFRTAAPLHLLLTLGMPLAQRPFTCTVKANPLFHQAAVHLCGKVQHTKVAVLSLVPLIAGAFYRMYIWITYILYVHVNSIYMHGTAEKCRYVVHPIIIYR